jgi:hypothetical protein
MDKEQKRAAKVDDNEKKRLKQLRRRKRKREYKFELKQVKKAKI